MNRTTITANARYLIGYDERSSVLKISNDELHNGVISFKERSGINSIESYLKNIQLKNIQTLVKVYLYIGDAPFPKM